MHAMTSLVCATGLVAGCAAMARPSVFNESFNEGNTTGWSYGPPGTIEPEGGNPGPYLHVPVVDTFAPQLRGPFNTTSPWCGDFRAMRIASVGTDLILFDVDFSAGGRPLSVILRNDNDTPGDQSDDWAVYSIGPENIPLVGEGWKSYDFDIPYEATSMPSAWRYIQFGPGSPPAVDWTEAITDVSQVVFFYGDPELFFIFQQWDVGADNIRATLCIEDLDSSGAVGFEDLNILLNDFGQTGPDLPGSIDGDGDVDFADLNILLSAYGQAC